MSRRQGCGQILILIGNAKQNLAIASRDRAGIVCFNFFRIGRSQIVSAPYALVSMLSGYLGRLYIHLHYVLWSSPTEKHVLIVISSQFWCVGTVGIDIEHARSSLMGGDIYR